MNDDSDPLRDFNSSEGWSIDYTKPATKVKVRNQLADPDQRELLITDYEQAAADARNRDRTLHNSVYLGFVILGVLANAVIGNREDPKIVFLVSLVGFVVFLFLTFWSGNSRGARNASWDRRSEIEDMVKVAYGLVLRSNDSSFKRLTRNAERPGCYYLEEKDGYQDVSIGDLAPCLHGFIALGFTIIALVQILKLAGCI